MKKFTAAEAFEDGPEESRVSFEAGVHELDENSDRTQRLVAEGKLVEVVEEAPTTPENTEQAEVETPAPEVLEPRGFFSLEVNWREGTTDSEKEAAMPFIKEFTDSLAESQEDHFPLCMDSFTVKRDR